MRSTGSQQMSLQSEMTSVTCKAKTQKCKPSLGLGVKTDTNPNIVSGRSRH